jgi:hypothetical protein
LRALLEEQTAGSPVDSRKWVRHSVARLTELLRRQGYDVSLTTVYRLLDDLGYSLNADFRGA